MRLCKADSYKHDSQRQRHDGTCSSAAAGGPQVVRPCPRSGVSNWRPSSCWETTSSPMPLTLGVMLVTVNLAMPHGTCSLATAGGPPI
ncbi:unnamed protein product [Staurois parvus]|uniref:Uncharacterized protein n=1 Tax=Staurois parvus TaxID=386267 RepID=A0ABN9BUG5_9NEOB|nr:unnamed protein product [Staurois parvus]